MVPLFQSLITATGVVMAAILARQSYVKQKERDREEDNIKAFHGVLYHAARLHQPGQDREDTEWFLGESRARYDETFNYLTVIASDRVFLCATDLHDRMSRHYEGAIVNPEKMGADEGIGDLYAKLIVAMRNDCFEETKLSKEQINPRLNW